MNWLLFLDLDGTLWDHLDVSATNPPYYRVSQDTIRDSNGDTLTLKPGVIQFILWTRSNGGILSSCSWNKPDIALSALEALGVSDLFDYHRISPDPRKYLLIADLLSEMHHRGIDIPQKLVFYIDDRNIHMDDIHEKLPHVNFIHMWKGARDYTEAREIIEEKMDSPET